MDAPNPHLYAPYNKVEISSMPSRLSKYREYLWLDHLWQKTAVNFPGCRSAAFRKIPPELFGMDCETVAFLAQILAVHARSSGSKRIARLIQIRRHW
jgi:hypothetical protein